VTRRPLVNLEGLIAQLPAGDYIDGVAPLPPIIVPMGIIDGGDSDDVYGPGGIIDAGDSST